MGKTVEPDEFAFHINKSTVKSAGSSTQAPSDNASYVMQVTLLLTILLLICNTLEGGRDNAVVLQVAQISPDSLGEEALGYAMVWLIITAKNKAQWSQTQPGSQM